MFIINKYGYFVSLASSKNDKTSYALIFVDGATSEILSNAAAESST